MLRVSVCYFKDSVTFTSSLMAPDEVQVMYQPSSLIKKSVLLLTLSGCIVSEVNAGDFIENTGTVLSVALPLVAGAMSLSKDDVPGRNQLAEVLTFTVGTTYGLKYAIDAKRPNGGDHSFPSAHTSVSVAASDFIGRRYGWNYGVPAYLAAGFVGYSRVDAKAHHRYDVLAGAAIGILGNLLFTTHLQDGGTKLSILPVKEGGAFRLSYAW